MFPRNWCWCSIFSKLCSIVRVSPVSYSLTKIQVFMQDRTILSREKEASASTNGIISSIWLTGQAIGFCLGNLVSGLLGEIYTLERSSMYIVISASLLVRYIFILTSFAKAGKALGHKLNQNLNKMNLTFTSTSLLFKFCAIPQKKNFCLVPFNAEIFLIFPDVCYNKRNVFE